MKEFGLSVVDVGVLRVQCWKFGQDCASSCDLEFEGFRGIFGSVHLCTL